MEKIPELVEQVAEMKGFFVEGCDDKLNLDRKFLIGAVMDGSTVAYCETLEAVQLFLGIKVEVINEDGTFQKVNTYTFEEVEANYKKEWGMV